MKDDKRNNTDELMDAWEGIRPEYLEEADQVFLHGKKGQRRRRTAILLAAAAVFIAAVGIGMVLIIRTYIGKPAVSADPDTQTKSGMEDTTKADIPDSTSEETTESAASDNTSENAAEQIDPLQEDLSPNLIPDRGQNWLEAAQEFAEVLTAPGLPDPEIVTWQKTAARAFDPDRGLISDPDLTTDLGAVEILRFYTTDQSDRVSFTDAPYQDLLENWNSSEREVPEGSLPAIYEDPEVPDDAYVCRIYCWIKKYADGWHLYGGGSSLGEWSDTTSDSLSEEDKNQLLAFRIFEKYEELLGEKDRSYTISGGFRRLVIENGETLGYDFDDMLSIYPSPNGGELYISGADPDSVYRLAPEDKTVFILSDTESLETRYEIHAYMAYGSEVERFMLVSADDPDLLHARVYVRDHSADYELAGNYVLDHDPAEGISDQLPDTFLNISYGTYSSYLEMQLFLDGEYQGCYCLMTEYTDEKDVFGNFILKAYDGISPKPRFIIPMFADPGTEEPLPVNGASLGQGDNPSERTGLGGFVKQEKKDGSENEALNRYFEIVGQSDHPIYLAYCPIPDTGEFVMELDQLYADNSLVFYNASGTVSDRQYRFGVSEDAVLTEVAPEVLNGLQEDLIVQHSSADSTCFFAVLENTGLIVFLNQGEIHCFMPALSGSAVGRFSLRGWYDEALCYAAGDVTMKGEAIRIPDRGQSYIEAVQEYFDSRNEIRMKLPHGCKYANLYAKSIVEEADTKEVPAQYRERYENDSHEILGAFRCTNIWAPENEAAYRAQIAGANTEHSGDDPEVPDGAYWGTVFGWARKDPDGWWYIAVDGMSLGWPPDG